jgi:hypothetical protein
VLSGLFFDPGTQQAGATATFLKSDATTQGNWSGAYGSQGTDIAGYAAALPSYAVVSTSGTSNYTWTSSTSDPRAPQNPANPSGSRVAACWYSGGGTTFTIDINLTDGQAHDLALYFLDWLNGGRVETVQIIDATTDAVLDTETVSSFGGGEYLQWQVSGHLVINVTATVGANAVISGIFLDPTAGPNVSATSLARPAAVQGPNPIDASSSPSAIAIDALAAGDDIGSRATPAASGTSSARRGVVRIPWRR